MAFSTADFYNMKNFFAEGHTRSLSFRKQMLQTLAEAIRRHEKALTDALYKDLHKPEAEAFGTEIGFCYAEISHALKHLKEWMRPQKTDTPLVLFPASSKIVRDPLGVCLIIAPWNYPFQLLIGPLIGAIVGGNCSVLKPSEFTPHTAAVIESMIKENFNSNYITVVQGDGAQIVPQLMHENNFDHIFFTGSTTVGKIIAKQAAEKLTSVTLELGGKSPCIIDKYVDLKTAVARIAWGKFTNAGQTCVAPDYILVQEERKVEFINAMNQKIKEFYGNDPQQSPDYGRIVNEKRFQTLSTYLTQGKIISGGETNAAEKYIAPTMMEGVPENASIMQEEIFGPILPVITYGTKEEALKTISKNPDPLSLYVFSNREDFQQFFIENVSFGGGCINNTLMHLGNPELPFGGVRSSGTGQYHGEYSFQTFTRPKAILRAANWIDPAAKYPPYKKWKLALFRKLMK